MPVSWHVWQNHHDLRGWNYELYAVYGLRGVETSKQVNRLFGYSARVKNCTLEISATSCRATSLQMSCEAHAGVSVSEIEFVCCRKVECKEALSL